MEFARTRLATDRLCVLAHTDSTNADLKAFAVAQPLDWPSGSVVLTTDQRRGRGRLDRVWVAPAGAALAMSVLWDISRVPVRERSWIPLAAGLAAQRAISHQVPTSHRAALKWPNDVLVGRHEDATAQLRKIAGVLVEMLPGSSEVNDRVVVGIGINTALTAVQSPVPGATSFAMMGTTGDKDRLAADLLEELSTVMNLLQGGQDAVESGLHEQVSAVCATVGQPVRVLYPNETDLVGTAESLAADGRLIVRSGAERVLIGAGDILHLR